MTVRTRPGYGRNVGTFATIEELNAENPQTGIPGDYGFVGAAAPFTRVESTGTTFQAPVSGGGSLPLAVRRAAVMLDSISANNNDSTAAALKYRSEGWFHWLNARLGWPMTLVANAGVSGDTTTGLLARINTDVVAFTPEISFVLGGTNDIFTANATGAQVIANLQTIYETLRDAGSFVVAMTILPRTFVDSTKLGYQLQVNEWIESYCRGKKWIMCVDTFSTLVDPTSAQAAPVAGLFYDAAPAVHPNNKGARALSLKLYQALAGLSFQPRKLVSSDAQKGSVAPTINLLENPLFIRTTGTASSGGITGATSGLIGSGATSVDIGANWNIGRATGSITATVSLEAQADGFGNAQKLVISSAGTTQDMELVSSSVHALATAGAKYRGVVVLQVDAGSTVLRRHMLQLLATAGGTSVTASCFENVQNEVALGSEAYTLTLVTPDITVPAGSVTNLQLKMAFRFAAAGDATVRVSRACLEPVAA